MRNTLVFLFRRSEKSVQFPPVFLRGFSIFFVMAGSFQLKGFGHSLVLHFSLCSGDLLWQADEGSS